MNVLVTGADGFVGKVLTKVLQLRGANVTAAVRMAKPGFVAIGDISAATDWRYALAGCDVVIHLAARVHQMNDRAANPLAAFRQVNTDGTLSLAQQAAEAGVSRFIFLSTVKVLGEERDYSYVETDLPAPADAYAFSKWEAEQGLAAFSKNGAMEVVIIRPPLVYGPGVKGNFASLVRWISKGWPLPFGNISNKRSLVGLGNLVDFIALCAYRDKSPQAANQVFLISDGEDVSTSELMHKVALAYMTTAKLLPIPVGMLRNVASLLDKSAEAERLLGSLTVDITKARNLLGWKPIMTMDQQLQKMAKDAALS